MRSPSTLTVTEVDPAVEQPGRRVWLATIDDEPVGVLETYQPGRWFDGAPANTVNLVWVHPAHRRRGAARALYAAATAAHGTLAHDDAMTRTGYKVRQALGMPPGPQARWVSPGTLAREGAGTLRRVTRHRGPAQQGGRLAAGS